MQKNSAIANKEKEPIKPPEYTDLEKKFRSKIIQEMMHAKTQRDQKYPEFDDMDYETYWRTNAKAANSYLPPKNDEQDVRVTSGATGEKKNTLLANLLNLNLEPDIEAYDEDDSMVMELGQNMEDMVRKSRKIEEYDDKKRPFFYNEFLSQGCVLIEDEFREYRISGKKLPKNFSIENIEKMKWEDDITKVYSECSTRMHIGLNVYFGNIRESDVQMQPYIILRRIMTYSEAKARYGHWERFKYVPENFASLSSTGNTETEPYNYWTLEGCENGMVEELRYMNRWTNDYMPMLNGVMMFPVWGNGTFPLSGILGDCVYPVAFSVAEPITNFVYGKSVPAKTKVDQSLFDEMFKAIVIKTRKSYMPPIANNSGQKLSKRIFWAGNIVEDVNPEKIQEIGQNGGVSNADMNAIQFVKSIIDNKSVDPIMEGQSGGQRTASEVEEMRKQSMITMGICILGIVSLERQLANLRILNIMKNWTKPIQGGLYNKLNKYRTMSIGSDFEDGTKGIREIKMTEELPDEDQVYAEEKIRKMATGKEYRITYINPKVLETLKYRWFIEINPTAKQSNALRRAQFEETFTKMVTMFIPLGVRPNLEYWKKQWAMHAEMDPEKAWEQAPEMPQGMPGMPPMPGAPQMGAPVGSQLTPDAMPKPSVNTLQQG